MMFKLRRWLNQWLNRWACYRLGHSYDFWEPPDGPLVCVNCGKEKPA